jgi:hypothetical protein
VHLSVQKIFRGLYPWTPVLKRTGGKAKWRGGIGSNGRKRMGREKDEGEGMEGKKGG